MHGPYDYGAFVDAGPHCGRCREITSECICSVCEWCDEHALEPVMVEACNGSMVHAECLDNANDAACEREVEAHLSEPPVTADQRHAAAWAQKLELSR